MSSVGAVLFPWKGKVFGSSHWLEVKYRKEGADDIKFGVYDPSAVVDGKAPIYQKMGAYNMVKRSIMCIISAPFYIVGTAAYYLLRIIPVTIWIIGGIIKESICRDGVRKYKWSHIHQETYYSLKQLVKTGYGVGYFAGLCMSIFSPLNGWKIASSYEKAWSDGADYTKSSPSSLLLMMTVPCIVLPALLTLPYLLNPSLPAIFSPSFMAIVSPTLVLICIVAYTILAVDWRSSYHPHGYVPVCRQPIGYVIIPEKDGRPKVVESLHGNATFKIQNLSEEKKHCMPSGCYPNNPCCYEPIH